MTGKRTKATGDNLVNAGAAEAAGEGGSGQMLPANQNDIEAARDTLSGNIDQPTLHQLLLGVLSAAQANAPKAPAKDPRTAPPRDRSPDVVITKDVTIMPSAREQLAAIRTEVQANDAPKLTAPHEQREQLDEGTLMLLETAITALDANEPQLAVAGECLKIAHRRLKCYSVALAKAGPGANGNFTAPYEIWHGRRRNFTKPEFKPEALDKGDIESALAKTRKSVAADRDENLAATVLGALLVAAGFRAPRPAQPPPAQRDNTQAETKNTAKRPAPGPAEPTRPRTKVARKAQEPHPDPGAPSRNEQAVPEGPPPRPYWGKNHQSARDHGDFVSSAIEGLLESETIKPCQSRPFMTCPLVSLVYKRQARPSWRPVIRQSPRSARRTAVQRLPHGK
ncbi:hypothetical protein VOLCADRAFT_105453 [Volvox carteri f. nagariensis]|uniref:Uncharacterized protein n=1 Tax=Volvox carteri f. nagariensis TaxID=3068 RepID=D8U0Y0_VOLCA|nr:uncharacterized protein VOLCADRAFT_105453 [Volvox carteri f. nagariensis]EFJ46459.1 hypothetical protein VOLCADRAFT_105453 [Volvox carteri f. nagariensis]|eukprot:XP_002952316.1 hypothetical protein VOLCADRAFT_105453 [Volvox carteri f. nagariensis]